MEDQFKLLFECYISGQMSERQWQEHLKHDKGLKEWYEAFRAEKKEILKERMSTL